ncbi:FG-GAP-like repeat-containing protein [Aureispira sp. CCB-QB1]|uniref:FG-GAP-like repeat-containing protein n=1 Tax=Aureispira sp. CCB-QB1 TaxID=1313421 RepID=UPI00069829EF|nr:FG-GAP-like repeat-containing protein [Aureispira sp. CCB-QB1]
MKKQTMYNRLKQEYTKLNQRIQKAMQTGRFYGYTEFKQQQLLGRLKRFSFQIKQLGAGVAVVTALGMATPAVGQSYNFAWKQGADNPFDGFTTSTQIKGLDFVDLDGDGDQDLFVFSYRPSSTNIQSDYYENTGTATSPSFTLQSAANNPLDTLSDKNTFSFVDIDGDGDLDLFTSLSPFNSATEELNYYENTGTSTNPSFTLQSTANNPLDSVLTHVANLNLANEDFGFYPSFVDIDGDGDLDCFMGIYSYSYSMGGAPAISDNDKLWYYENIGTTTNPVFQRQNSSNHPAASLFSTSIVTGKVMNRAQFYDIDADGDYDMITNFFNTSNQPRYFRNEGTSTSPNLVSLGIMTGTPVDSLYAVSYSNTYWDFADLDGDGDLDAIVNRGFTLQYLENLGPVVGVDLIPNIAEAITVSPNPTTGQVALEKALTGRLQIFNSAGQEVYSKELEQEKNLDLSDLETGLYLLHIKEGKRNLQQTIIIQK